MAYVKNDFNGIYSDMFEYLGEKTVREVFENYRGQQVTFPMRLYSKEYVIDYIKKEYDKKNLKELSRELGYSERWIKRLLDDSKDKIVNG